MKRKILSALLALVISLGVAITLTASPAAAATDCPSTSGYGDRLCFDPTTGYGPVMYVYTPGNTLSMTIPMVTCGQFTIAPYSIDVYSQSAWYNAPYNGIATVNGHYFGSTPCGTKFAYTYNQSHINTLIWYDGGCCPNMELVLVN